MIILLVIILLALLVLGLLLALAGICAFHLAVGNGRFESLETADWAGLCGGERCGPKQRHNH